MPINVNQIGVGKCYVTPTQQVRRVLSHANGDVTYESRGRRVGPFSNRVTVGETKFAEGVDRQVHCDWDPDFGGPSL